MHIKIDTPTGATIDLHVLPNGTATVRSGRQVIGSCRWTKDENELYFYSMPLATFETEEPDDTGDRLVFEFEKT